MELQVTQKENTAYFEIKGDIDERGAEELKQKFRELNQATLKNIVLNFRHVTHIGSAGIGKLLLFYKDLALRGGEVKIENASKSIYELFCVLKLDSIIKITS